MYKKTLSFLLNVIIVFVFGNMNTCTGIMFSEFLFHVPQCLTWGVSIILLSCWRVWLNLKLIIMEYKSNRKKRIVTPDYIVIISKMTHLVVILSLILLQTTLDFIVAQSISFDLRCCFIQSIIMEKSKLTFCTYCNLHIFINLIQLYLMYEINVIIMI